MQSISYLLEGVSPSVCASMLDALSIADDQSESLPSPERLGAGRLYTATLHVAFEEYSISMFHACRAESCGEVMDRIAARLSSHLLAHVEIREGIDLDHPIVARLVPREICRRLSEYGDCNRSHGPLRQGGDLHIQERAGA